MNWRLDFGFSRVLVPFRTQKDHSRTQDGFRRQSATTYEQAASLRYSIDRLPPILPSRTQESRISRRSRQALDSGGPDESRIESE